jgi:AmmeMemoRadiSam system protein B
MKMRTSELAGTWYAHDPSHLEQQLGKFFSVSRPVTGNPLGIVSPHAGYVYSGQVAAYAFGTIPGDFAGTFVVIGPSHKGFMTCVSEVQWETPLGVVDNDVEFVRALDIETDESSFRYKENSIEVQIPFIKYRFPRARIAPVQMAPQDYLSALRLAEKILAAIRLTKREVRIVASSDFSHEVPDKKAKEDDLYVIEPLKTLDTKEFYRRIAERQAKVCGYGPITAMVTACIGLGAKAAELVKYATSGDVTGDTREVVGYAAIAVI